MLEAKYLAWKERTRDMIAITGATGQLGRLVIGKLKDKVPASDIVALARSTAKAANLGAAAREADYDKPRRWSAPSTEWTHCC